MAKLREICPVCGKVRDATIIGGNIVMDWHTRAFLHCPGSYKTVAPSRSRAVLKSPSLLEGSYPLDNLPPPSLPRNRPISGRRKG